MILAWHLTFVAAPSIVKSFVADGIRRRLRERPESFAHDQSTTCAFTTVALMAPHPPRFFTVFTANDSMLSAEFGFTGMTHRAVQPWEDGLFDGDENVIVDFKYSNSPKVTWWFDHHQSAFLTPADAENFREHPGPHMFYEPDYKSCTKLIADTAREKFGFDTAPLKNLIHWGDIIDGAQFPTRRIGGGTGGAGDAIGAGDRSGAGRRRAGENYSRAGVPAAGGNGEAADGREASGAAAGAAPTVD